MSRRQFPVLPIIAMLAIMAGGYGLYKNIVFEEIEIEIEQSAEARSNRLLAANFLLNTEGFDFDIEYNRRVFAELDQSDGVLWLTDATELEDKREAEKIITWVESGGILLTSPAGQYGLDTSTISGWLFEQFGIEELHNKDKTAEEVIAERSNENDSQRTVDASQYDITTENASTVIDSPHLIYRSVGEGYVAVYSDEELFDTDRLDEADQGYLLLWLTQTAQSKNVSIVFRPASSPGLFTVVWNKFTLAICLMGLVLVGFLRWAASRLGPIEQELPPIKNNIMAHLEARGEFWYRHKYTNKIIGNVQKAAKENILAKSGKPGTDNDPGDKSMLIKKACEQLRCSPDKAEQILFETANNDSTILRSFYYDRL